MIECSYYRATLHMQQMKKKLQNVVSWVCTTRFWNTVSNTLVWTCRFFTQVSVLSFQHVPHLEEHSYKFLLSLLLFYHLSVNWSSLRVWVWVPTSTYAIHWPYVSSRITSFEIEFRMRPHWSIRWAAHKQYNDCSILDFNWFDLIWFDLIWFDLI